MEPEPESDLHELLKENRVDVSREKVSVLVFNLDDISESITSNISQANEMKNEVVVVEPLPVIQIPRKKIPLKIVFWIDLQWNYKQVF